MNSFFDTTLVENEKGFILLLFEFLKASEQRTEFEL